MLDKLKELIRKMNESGVPLPLIRVDGKPSLTATFCFIAFNTALLGQIGKLSKFLGPVDLDSANYLFFGSLAAYLGRKMSGNKTKMELDKKEDK